MSELSEEEIIQHCENAVVLLRTGHKLPIDYDGVINGLLDLYQKEKEKNKWKPISEYNREKYDWVLVKYFDGDYECVPEVAEQRWDGKWYTSEKEIPFEVKYFFDIQELLEERN